MQLNFKGNQVVMVRDTGVHRTVRFRLPSSYRALIRCQVLVWVLGGGGGDDGGGGKDPEIIVITTIIKTVTCTGN